MSHDVKKFLGKDYATPGIILGHGIRNSPEITLSEPKIFMQNAPASCFRDPKLLVHAHRGHRPAQFSPDALCGGRFEG
jgi:hypothetical protein